MTRLRGSPHHSSSESVSGRSLGPWVPGSLGLWVPPSSATYGAPTPPYSREGPCRVRRPRREGEGEGRDREGRSRVEFFVLSFVTPERPRSGVSGQPWPLQFLSLPPSPASFRLFFRLRSVSRGRWKLRQRLGSLPPRPHPASRPDRPSVRSQNFLQSLRTPLVSLKFSGEGLCGGRVGGGVGGGFQVRRCGPPGGWETGVH